MRGAHILVWLAVALTPPAARAADEPALPPALVSLLTGPEHRAALLAAARAVNGPGVQGCTAANYTVGDSIVIVAPVQTDAAGKVVAGTWREQVRESGCNADRVLNTITTAGPNGALDTRPLLPGSTIADPQLQRDSVKYAAGAMGAMPTGCDQGGVLDTRFVGQEGQPPGAVPPANGPVRPWTEIWTLQACAKRAVVEMRFTPDATGTDIRATPAKP